MNSVSSVNVATTGNEKKLKWSLLVSLMIIGVSWMLPYVGFASILLPAKLNLIDPSQKVQWVATFSASGMVVAAISNIFCGAISDRTRTKYGKRSPWILGGAILSAALFFAMAFASNIEVLLVLYFIYLIGQNAIVASSVAIISDRTNKFTRGVASSFSGVGSSIGAYGAGIVASQFIASTTFGISIFGVIALVGTIIGLFLLKEQSNINEPKKKMSAKVFVESFVFPIKDSRDFYLALIGKFMIVTGQYAVTGYELYIFTDYMNLSTTSTTKYISLVSIILMCVAIPCSLLSGPIADKIGSIKFPVALCSLLLVIGVSFPYFDAKPWTMLAYAFIGGIGTGAYLSVDQALNVAVLPNSDTAAKDLGIINLANTFGQVAGPLITSAVITSTGGYKMIFPSSVAFLLVGTVLVLFIKRVK